MSKSFMINRRTALGGAAALAAGAALPAPRAGQQAHRRRHLGRRLFAPARQEHRDAAARARGLGRRQGRGRRPAAPRQDDGREGAAPRHLRHAGPVGQRHVRDATSRAWPSRSTIPRCPNAANLIPAMKYPYGVGHIYSGKVVLYNPKLMDGAEELRRHARPQARRQARHHRHPVPVHHDGRGPGVGRHGGQLRAGQGAAARLQEGRRAHLSRPTRPSPRRSRPRRSPAASCGRRAPCNGRTPASTSRPWRPRKACRCTSRAS